MERFEVYNDNDGKLRFNIKAKNGKIMAVSGPYDSLKECKADIKKIKDGAGHCEIVEIE